MELTGEMWKEMMDIKRAMLFEAFVLESNKIEGIVRENVTKEREALQKFVSLDQVTVDDLIELNKVFQPDAPLRDSEDVPDVVVDGHRAPPSGETIRVNLENLLSHVYRSTKSPFQVHMDYETLLPFLDGNGRTGRALWLWQMVNRYDYGMVFGFLHEFYYQSFKHYRHDK